MTPMVAPDSGVDQLQGGGCEGCRSSSFGEEKVEQGGAGGDRAAHRLKGGTVGSRGGGGGW
jgi:hypothetical protein